MSVEDCLNGFELNESDFPELEKGQGRKMKGRKSAVAARLGRQMAAAGAVVIKTIDDPNHVLGKRRKERVLSESNDGMAANVAYSINRKNRWDEVSPSSLLENAEGNEVGVSVVERVFTMKDKTPNVRALHTKNAEGDVLTTTAGGKGTNLNALVTGPGKKVRGRKARKEAELLEETEETSTPIREPQVQYNIYKAHPNEKVLAGKMFNRAYNIRKAGRARAQNKFDVEDYELSELEQSVHIDEEVYKPSRDFKFCLGDYMKAATSPTVDKTAVYVRRQSIESVQGDDADEAAVSEQPRPFDLLDISAVLRAPTTFESTIVNASKWQNFNFVKQADELSTENRPVKWLDVESQRVAVDLSKSLGSYGELNLPNVVVVFEKTQQKNHFRVLLNATVAPSGPFSSKMFKEIVRSTASLSDVCEKISRLVSEWHAAAAPSADGKLAGQRFVEHRDMYLPAYNSTMLANTAQVLTAEKMESMVREEGRQMHGDTFERIDAELLADLDDEELAVVPNVDLKVKCVTCSSGNELFELDDCWQCRKCLNKHVIGMIRAKSFPLEIPFAMREGQSSYDILPALIPLQLIQFYTKLTATEMLEHSDVEIGDVGECPSCKQMVQIDRPNEYNTSMCSSCCVHFCSECSCEPHWPMSCETYAAWSEKWNNEYEYHYRHPTPRMQKKITCQCGHGPIVVMDTAHHAKCENCRREFDPCTMYLKPCTYVGYDPKTNKPIDIVYKGYWGRVYPVEVVAEPMPKTIKKEFCEILSEARKMRFDAKKSEFERNVRKNRIEKGDKLKELRKTILVIVENGLGFVYMEKIETGGVKQMLMSLFKSWFELELEVAQPRAEFASRVDNIENSLAKTIDALKKLA